jgi:hypothetical protein
MMGEIKAVALETKDGKIFVQSEDENFVGKNIFARNDKGEISDQPAKDGDIVLNDGRTLKVKDGKVLEVVAKQDDKIKALEDELAALKAEKAESEKKADKKEKEATDMKSEMEKVNASFRELQTMVMGKAPDTKPPKQRTIAEGSEDDPLIGWYKKVKTDMN